MYIKFIYFVSFSLNMTRPDSLVNEIKCKCKLKIKVNQNCKNSKSKIYNWDTKRSRGGQQHLLERWSGT